MDWDMGKGRGFRWSGMRVKRFLSGGFFIFRGEVVIYKVKWGVIEYEGDVYGFFVFC